MTPEADETLTVAALEQLGWTARLCSPRTWVAERGGHRIFGSSPADLLERAKLRTRTKEDAWRQ